MADPDLDDIERRMDGAISALVKEFQGLRTGRASTQLLESIMVEAYGASMPISQVATLSVPEPAHVVGAGLGIRAMPRRRKRRSGNPRLG